MSNYQDSGLIVTDRLINLLFSNRMDVKGIKLEELKEKLCGVLSDYDIKTNPEKIKIEFLCKPCKIVVISGPFELKK